MKINALIFCFLSFTSLIYSQVPQAMNYQGIVTDANGKPIANEEVTVTLSINGTSINQTTSVVTSEIGGFIVKLEGDFSSIDWESGPFYLNAEISTSEGLISSNTELLSVPFAFYAARGKDNDADPTNEIQDLSFIEFILTISGGNSVNLEDLAFNPDLDWSISGPDIYKNSGNVGIGLDAPEFLLDVNGTARFGEEGEGNELLILNLSGTRDWAFKQLFDRPETALELKNIGGGEVKNFIISTGGRVGINATNPRAKFHSNDDLGTAGIFGTSETGIGVKGTSNSGRGVEGYSENSVGIVGTSLNFSGVVGESSFLTGVVGVSEQGTGVSGISEKGTGVIGNSNNSSSWDFYANGRGGNYGSTSSKRWKRNVINIPNPLEILSSLRGVYFDWDEEHGGQHDIGFIAEEVGKVIPEIVGYEENGIDATSMDYSKMTPLLVEALNVLYKKYNEETTALKKEIELLKARLEKIDSIISSINEGSN